MCGNFGLVLLGHNVISGQDKSTAHNINLEETPERGRSNGLRLDLAELISRRAHDQIDETTRSDSLVSGHLNNYEDWTQNTDKSNAAQDAKTSNIFNYIEYLSSGTHIEVYNPDLDSSIHGPSSLSRMESIKTGIVVEGNYLSFEGKYKSLVNLADKPVKVCNPLEIIQRQCEKTEFRGGQAGGISVNNYKINKEVDRMELKYNPFNVRVRSVARKRFPLAMDLKRIYLRSAPSKRQITSDSTVTGRPQSSFHMMVL